MKNEPIKEHLNELTQTVSHMVSNPLQPLSAFRSIKMKIGILVLGAVFTTTFVYWLGLYFGNAWPSVAGIVAAIVALILTRFFAKGLTTPLREMANLSSKIANGNYDVKIETTSRDEIGALAKTFNKMAKELQQTENLRRELIANASHELKTPLTALQAQLENLVDGVETPDVQKMQILLGQTEHLSALVKDLLDLSKLESGVTPLQLAPVNINSLLENVKQLTLQTSNETSIEIDPTSAEIEGDYHRLFQVFTNIFTNSIKYAGQGSKIVCSFEILENSVAINIDDNGPGIKGNKKDLVFERFYRVDESRNLKEGGSGIGLAITKQIITMHNGTIAISDSQMSGLRIRIELPQKQILDKARASDSSKVSKTKSFDLNKKITTKENTKWNSIQSTT